VTTLRRASSSILRALRASPPSLLHAIRSLESPDAPGSFVIFASLHPHLRRRGA
jgi:hypothetical protein